MKLNIQKRVFPLLCALALIVACGFGFAMPSLAEDTVDEEYVYAEFGDFTIRLPNLANGFSPRAVFISLRVSDDGNSFFCSAAYVTGYFGVNKKPTYGYTTDNWQVYIPEGSYVVLTTNEIVFSAENSVMDFEWGPGFATNETYTYDMGFSTGVGVWGGYELGDIWDVAEIVELVYLDLVDSVSLSVSTSAPYYPGTDVQFNAEVTGTGIEPGSPESTVYWYLHGNTSPDTYLEDDPYGNAVLHIANDETAISLEIEAISTYDSTKSATCTLPITYPLEGVQIIPGDTQYLMESGKRREIQFSLLLPNGEPFDYQLLEWTTHGDYGQYFRIDDTGLLIVEANAPAGANCTVRFAYQNDPSTLSPDSVTVHIVTQQEGIYDQLTPTPEQSDKSEQLEDAIGDAAGKLENNNSSLEQLTPTKPQISTDLELDEDNLLAVSPLVTNIWSINGVGRMIAIVLMVATVAYVFFGKRDG